MNMGAEHLKWQTGLFTAAARAPSLLPKAISFPVGSLELAQHVHCSFPMHCCSNASQSCKVPFEGVSLWPPEAGRQAGRPTEVRHLAAGPTASHTCQHRQHHSRMERWGVAHPSYCLHTTWHKITPPPTMPLHAGVQHSPAPRPALWLHLPRPAAATAAVSGRMAVPALPRNSSAPSEGKRPPQPCTVISPAT